MAEADLVQHVDAVARRLRARVVARRLIVPAVVILGVAAGALILGPPARHARIVAGLVLALLVAMVSAWARARVSRAQAARALDAMVGGDHHDRTLCAQDFLARAEALPATQRGLAAAAVNDALALVPATAINAPWPVGGGAVILLLVLAFGALVVVKGHDARHASGLSHANTIATAHARALPLRQAAERMRVDALAVGDDRIAAIARQLARLADEADAGHADDAAIARTLERLTLDARQAAARATTNARALRDVAALLNAHAGTQAIASALRTGNGERGSGSGATRAQGARDETFNPRDAREAGESAARGAASMPTRDQAANAAAATAQSSDDALERKLERLTRDLNDAADACARDPQACGQSLGRAADDARSLARADDIAEEREAAGQSMATLGGAPRGGSSAANTPRSTDARRATAQAANNTNNNPGRGQANDHGSLRADNDAQNTHGAAAGASNGGSSNTHGAPGSTTDPAGEHASAGAASEGAASDPAASSGGTSTSGAPAMGDGEGGSPRGKRTRALGGGHAVSLTDAAGDGRDHARIIADTAAHGFSDTPYRHVYAAYHAAAERALDDHALPESRRALVRRYFDLIHPAAEPDAP